MAFPLGANALTATNGVGVYVPPPAVVGLKITPTRTWSLALNNNVIFSPVQRSAVVAVRVSPPQPVGATKITGIRSWAGIGVNLVAASQGWHLVD